MKGRDMATKRFIVELDLDDAPEHASFAEEFIENLRSDTLACWGEGGESLMGYEGPYVRSVRVSEE